MEPKKYNIGGSDFTQKNFREVGMRKKYYIEYGKVTSEAFKGGNINLYGYLAEQCFDKDEKPLFDIFLEPFIEGDFQIIKDLQIDAEGQDRLIDFCALVLTDFLLLKTNGTKN